MRRQNPQGQKTQANQEQRAEQPAHRDNPSTTAILLQLLIALRNVSAGPGPGLDTEVDRDLDDVRPQQEDADTDPSDEMPTQSYVESESEELPVNPTKSARH